MAPPYVELRAHTAFSFGDGAMTPEALVTRAAALGYSALGITDTADLGGIVRFILEARRHGVRPVIGVELVVDGYPAAFLARTAEGYRNLAALVTRARSGRLEAWPRDTGAPVRGRPRVTWSDLAERASGLWALTGPASGEIAALLRAQRREDAAAALARWRERFGAQLAVEVQLHHAGRTEEALAGALIDLAEAERVPWVVTHEPRYLDRRGRCAHDVLTALRAGLTVGAAAAQGVLLPSGAWRLQPPEEMAARWAGREAGLEQSARIAADCACHLGWLRPPLPDYPVPDGHTADTYLREVVSEGARERWGAPDAPQRAQVDHELAVIQRLGFAGFFLVMWDAVREARSRGILCQGRGSAANSAVAYCLGITAVDPVRHGLLFERFLSDARTDGLTEAPDIDIDIEHDRREELLDYVYGRWRREHAAIACIVQTYHAPNAVRDVARALGYPAGLATTLSKRLHGLTPAEGAARLHDDLGARHGLDIASPRGRALLTAVTALHDLPRLRSTHPGGFVLSSTRLGDYLPIEPTTRGRTIVQFDKDDLDAVGIPKFDFLGLGALSHVRRAFDAIEVRTGTRPCMYRLPPDDRRTFRLIARGDTIGMFQIESRAQIASLIHTRPERLYDLVAQVALIRPGPIQARFVRPYTRRRRGLEPVSYPHPALEPILRRTQGIPIFQEQAMAIAMTLGGYTAAEADLLRRTMGHQRKQAQLQAALEGLRARMVERGVGAEAARQVTDDLRGFANYGFPESHAWSFALIAYATAWLKAHYPAEFYAGLLNAWPMGFYAPATLVHDAKRHRVEVRPPCLARGAWDATVEETGDARRPALRIGWRHVRGLGDRARDALHRAAAAGPFTAIGDVVRRAALTARETAALARAGAFVVWESDRRRAAWEALRTAGDTLPLAPARLGDETGGYLPDPLTRHDEILGEYAAMGLSVAGHPMERWREWCRRVGARHSHDVAGCRDRERVVVAGLVIVRQRPQTAKGTVFVLLEDEFGVINVIVPPPLVETNREILWHAPFLLVYGRVERDGPAVNVVGEMFKPLEAQGLVVQAHDFR